MLYLDDEPWFPPVEQADPEGLLLVTRAISPRWVLEAYRRGIFPWPTPQLANLVPWVSPDPRGVIELDRLHVSRRLAETLRSPRFRVTFDQAFDDVVAGCAARRRGQAGTWITPAMRRTYGELHRTGHAHSVEVWHAGQLAGGLYGVALGGYFAGESMFHRVRDASKIALVRTVERLRERGFTLFDVQQWTPHTGRMGATEISRAEFQQRLQAALSLAVQFGEPAR